VKRRSLRSSALVGAFVVGCSADDGAPPAADPGASALDRTRALWRMPNPALPGLPNPQRYEAAATPELVVDQVTGLSWQRSADSGPGEGGGFVGEDALAHCAALELGGHDDFRLPTRIELVSIVDDSVTGPALDPSAFPNENSEAFWSASSVPGDPEQRFHVNFFFGYTTANLTVYAQWVRCVRTAVAPESSALGPLTADADVVHDPATELSWQRTVAPEPLEFSEANAYCADLELAGMSDFRLPSMKELQTLVREDVTEGPLIDQAAFPATPADLGWTSSVVSGNPASAWLVRFSDGYALYAALSTPAVTRCVH